MEHLRMQMSLVKFQVQAATDQARQQLRMVRMPLEDASASIQQLADQGVPDRYASELKALQVGVGGVLLVLDTAGCTGHSQRPACLGCLALPAGCRCAEPVHPPCFCRSKSREPRRSCSSWMQS